MNNSGKTTRSAPAAAVRARLTFSTFPAMSPTVELSCAMAIASLSSGTGTHGKPLPPCGPAKQWAVLQGCFHKVVAGRQTLVMPVRRLLRYTAKQSRDLPSGRPQSRPATTQRHRTGWLEIASIKVKGLQAFLDHALDHHGLVILAEGCTLTPMADLGLCDFRNVVPLTE